MKRKNIKNKKPGTRILVAVIVCSVLFSCTKKYAEYNTNQYQATAKQLEADGYSVGQIFPAMMNAVTPAGDPPGGTNYVNSYQVGYNLAGDVFSGLFGQAGDWGSNTNNLTYGFNLSWVNEQFNLTGKLMAGWKKIKDITDQSKDSIEFSVAQVIKITGILRATDSYGPIPYSSIPTGTFTPFFDRQDSIYYSFFPELDRAISILYTQGAGAGRPLKTYDLIYAGDYLAWAKYANSLKLRLALRIVYVDATRAKKYAEEAVANPAGLLTGTADNALLSIKAGNGAFNYSNPLYTLCTVYQEARMGASAQSFLTGYSDPRIASYFTKSSLTGHETEYVGIRSGSLIARASYQPFSGLTATYATPMPWMQASEVYFLRAEGAIRGWNMNGQAKDLYESGIKASFDESGATIPATYLTDNTSKPADYKDYVQSGNSQAALTTITIKWDDAAIFETKLERIITQKWIALYPNGQEAWTEFRRTGYPKIFTVPNNKSSGTVNTATQVRRLPYPLAQYQQNAQQVAKGVSLLGGPDNGGTRLWWDKK